MRALPCSCTTARAALQRESAGGWRVELLDVLVIASASHRTLELHEVVDVVAHGADRGGARYGPGPVRLEACVHVCSAGDGVLGADRSLRGGQLLEGEARRTLLANALADVEVTGLLNGEGARASAFVLGERGGRKEIATGITGWISDPGRSRRREGGRDRGRVGGSLTS